MVVRRPTVPLLGAMSGQAAQLVENALEEEQYGYALDTIEIAMQQGLYPTRDIFLVTLAIVYTNAVGEKAARRNDSDIVDFVPHINAVAIDENTQAKAKLLLDSLCKKMPGAVSSFLPPFRHSNLFGEDIYAPVEREWLRQQDMFDAAENSLSSVGRKKLNVIEAPSVMRLALQMLDCRDVWQLLSIDTSGNEDKKNTKRRTSLSRNTNGGRPKRLVKHDTRDDDKMDTENIDAASSYDRKGTWNVLELLVSLWSYESAAMSLVDSPSTKLYRKEKELTAEEQTVKSNWWGCHLAQQFKHRDWKQASALAGTEVGDAYRVIRAGYLMTRKHDQARSQPPSRRSRIPFHDTFTSLTSDLHHIKKRSAAAGLHKEMMTLVEHNVLDRASVMRACNELLRAAEIRLLCSPTGLEVWRLSPLLIASIAQYLARTKSEDAIKSWTIEETEAFRSCIESPRLSESVRAAMSELQSTAAWLAPRTDWGEAEGREISRLLEDDSLADAVEQAEEVLSSPQWQLYDLANIDLAQRTRKSTMKRKRSSDEEDGSDATNDVETKLRAHLVAAVVRHRGISGVSARLAAQTHILAFLHSLLTKIRCDETADERQQVLLAKLQLLTTAVATTLHSEANDATAAVSKCWRGIKATFAADEVDLSKATTGLRKTWAKISADVPLIVDDVRQKAKCASLSIENAK